jgi:hypothetical protein
VSPSHSAARHLAVIAVAAAQINDELMLITSDLDGAEDIPDTLAALQRLAYMAADLAKWARRNGGRACAATVERMVDG